MIKHALLFSTLLFFSFSSFANEVECASSLYSLTSALPKVELPEFGFPTTLAKAPDFCFDPENGKAHLKEFEELKSKNIFDENNCSNLDAISVENHVLLINFMFKVMDKTPLNIYSLVKDTSLSSRYKATRNMALDADERYIVSNVVQPRKFSGSESLSKTDVLVIGGMSAAATYVGTVVSRKMYPGDSNADKRKHEMAGALINLGGTGVGYLAIETLGLGDKLGLSKHARKCAVTASGAVLLYAAAAGKEAYDKTKPKKHTVDANDFVATVLGGGGGVPFAISCGFNF